MPLYGASPPRMQLVKMKKETLIKLGVGGAPLAIGKAPFVVEKATERQTPEKALFTRLCAVTSAKQLVGGAARALSQYYFWLQRTDKPW